MSEPWHQTTGYTANTLSNPYHRLMNTSGNAFRDHAGSMVSEPLSPPRALFPFPFLRRPPLLKSLLWKGRSG